MKLMQDKLAVLAKKELKIIYKGIKDAKQGKLKKIKYDCFVDVIADLIKYYKLLSFGDVKKAKKIRDNIKYEDDLEYFIDVDLKEKK